MSIPCHQRPFHIDYVPTYTKQLALVHDFIHVVFFVGILGIKLNFFKVRYKVCAVLRALDTSPCTKREGPVLLN